MTFQGLEAHAGELSRGTDVRTFHEVILSWSRGPPAGRADCRFIWSRAVRAVRRRLLTSRDLAQAGSPAWEPSPGAVAAIETMVPFGGEADGLLKGQGGFPAQVARALSQQSFEQGCIPFMPACPALSISGGSRASAGQASTTSATVLLTLAAGLKL